MTEQNGEPKTPTEICLPFINHVYLRNKSLWLDTINFYERLDIFFDNKIIKFYYVI